MTFLSPLLFAAIMLIPLWLSTAKDTEHKTIAVVDYTNMYAQALPSNATYHFEIVQAPQQDIGKSKLSNDYYAILVISGNLMHDSTAVALYSQKQVGFELQSYIADHLNKYVENQKLEASHIPNIKQIIKASQSSIQVATIKLNANGQEIVTSSEVAAVIGALATFLIYLFIFMYGAQVMRGVVEEKTNRIVEIIISSVRPFELMMGKIIGIALVGLTQFLLWVLLTVIISNVAGIAMFGSSLAGIQQSTQLTAGTQSTAHHAILSIIQGLQGINFVEIIGYFIFYFIGGYLLYASLFAAIGSAVDNETDTQQFMLPVTIPIIFAFYAAFYSLQNPDGPLAFWCSIIPFTSPIVMMVRLPFDVPLWQKLLSSGLLIITFLSTTWLAAKIYRTGILMYGKKISWKELWKWLRYSNR
ncbi:ABC-2 type transport system permease protein [Microbacter margulisiae]|uniref:ABC-2 type transport system permease protein n=2 Tax=Microbacter margulisiae TaxID=1350067 RepID=A0A7W5DPZ4_9PORP|nr:ABC-2 type transport system permease protein [Microbacter margulisiae]